MPKKFIVLSENREQLGTVLTCSQFSVFCEKFFYKILCSHLFSVLGFFTKIIFTIFNKISPGAPPAPVRLPGQKKFLKKNFRPFSGLDGGSSQQTAGPGVAEIKIWGYPSSTVSF